MNNFNASLLAVSLTSFSSAASNPGHFNVLIPSTHLFYEIPVGSAARPLAVTSGAIADASFSAASLIAPHYFVKLAKTLSNTFPSVKTSTKSLPYSLFVDSGIILFGIALHGLNCLSPSSSSLAGCSVLSLFGESPCCP